MVKLSIDFFLMTNLKVISRTTQKCSSPYKYIAYLVINASNIKKKNRNWLSIIYLKKYIKMEFTPITFYMYYIFYGHSYIIDPNMTLFPDVLFHSESWKLYNDRQLDWDEMLFWSVLAILCAICLDGRSVNGLCGCFVGLPSETSVRPLPP